MPSPSAHTPEMHTSSPVQSSPTRPPVGAHTIVPPAATQSKPSGHGSDVHSVVHQLVSPRDAQKLSRTQSSLVTHGSPTPPQV